jgi:hypothetical membrane protein
MKHFYWFGILAGILYILAVIIGSALIPHYSHLNQYISEIEPLISHKYLFIITILFGLYNFFVMLFGIFQYLKFKDKSKVYKIQSIMVSIIGLLGLLMFLFPMSRVGEDITIIGYTHIMLVGGTIPLTILVTLLGYWTYREHKMMHIYSLITSIIIFIFGGLTAFFAATSTTGIGLSERITIGSFILWLMITGIYYRKYSR